MPAASRRVRIATAWATVMAGSPSLRFALSIACTRTPARRMGRIRFACDVCNAPLSPGEVCGCTIRRSQERPNRPPESPAPPSEPAGPVAMVEKKAKKVRAKKDETAEASSPDKSLFEAE